MWLDKEGLVITESTISELEILSIKLTFKVKYVKAFHCVANGNIIVIECNVP